jgi:hypothetical protein
MQQIIDDLQTLQAQRRNWLKAKNRLGNHIGAIKRGYAGGPTKKLPAEMEIPFAVMTHPMAEAQDILSAEIKLIEKAMGKLAIQLPGAVWWCSHRGMNIMGFAQIVGEAGDLGRFRNPSCLWKRFGLHVIEGMAARPRKDTLLDYSPSRRAVVKVIGNSIKMQGGATSPYRALYDARKIEEIAKAPDLKPAQHDNRAMRYMEKRLLRDLWCRWRDESGPDDQLMAA